MKELKALTKNLGSSEPVFKLTVDQSAGRISARLVEKYLPEVTDCPLSHLIRDKYEERFDNNVGVFLINKDKIATEAMDEIRNLMQIYIAKNSGMKSPGQSKIWKWYRYDQPQTSEYNDMLVMVYKYIRTFATSDMNISKWNDAENNKNTLALLQAIMERHEKGR